MKLTEFVSLVLRLQCMYVMMPFCESVCVCVCAETGIRRLLMPTCPLCIQRAVNT